jgi:hypothetical protein
VGVDAGVAGAAVTGAADAAGRAARSRTFCRAAKYAPEPAATMHARPTAAKPNRLVAMMKKLLTQNA